MFYDAIFACKHTFRILTKPQLIFSSPQGGTVHTYPLTGGATTFQRFLGCYLGKCKFCNTVEEAREHIQSLETSF